MVRTNRGGLDLAAVTFLVAALAGVTSACGSSPSSPDVGSLPDALLDAAPACREDAECEDGLACNGQERCVAGRCTPGAPIRCDDGVSCTTDHCSEELRRCVNRPVDADGDGHAALGCVDARGTPLGDDCVDTDSAVSPSAVELCDAMGIDEDCDARTLGGRDLDADGFVDASCCNGSVCGDDCNDAVPSASPDGTERCNRIDDDCDGRIDEGVQTTVYRDVDGDRRGDAAIPMMACASTPGYSEHDDDCDDASALRSPALLEACDGIDNDCDGVADPADSPETVSWYEDRDGDGFGDPSREVRSCAPPMGGTYSLLGTDCDDTTRGRHPAQPERCNGLDDDCNGAADFELAPGDLEDDDGDGRVDARCVPMPVQPDCDDRDASSFGGGAELCDGRDNDCDGNVDEGVEATIFFRDADDDGWGSEAGGVALGCNVVVGHVRRAGDCDDRDPVRYPGVEEICNGADEDCDGSVDEDPDGTLCTAIGDESVECRAGRCRVIETGGGCVAPLADCDTNGSCETDTSSSIASCGVCGRRCEGGNATWTCSAGSCGVVGCLPGFFDCDGRGTNGCESAAACGSISWATTWGDVDDDSPLGMGAVVDVATSSGEIYVLTSFTMTLEVSGSARTAPGDAAMVIALTSTGAFRWTTMIKPDPTGNVRAERIAVTSGGVMVVGNAVGGSTLYANVTPLGSLGAGSTGFVVNLSTATGSAAWTRLFPLGGVSVLGLDVGTTEVVIGGAFTGPGTDFGGGFVLSPSAAIDAYVARLNAATGATNRAFALGGPANEVITALAVRSSDGDIFVGGYYEGGGTTLGGIGLPVGGARDGFVARCSSGGGVGAAIGIATASAEEVTDVRVGGPYWYFSGMYAGSTTVGIRTFAGTTTGGFVAAVDYVTHAIPWANGIAGAATAPSGVRRIAVDPRDRVHAAFSASPSFTTQFGGVTFASSGPASHVATMSATSGGVFRLHTFEDGFGLLRAGAIAMMPDGSSVIAGSFDSTTTIDGIPVTSAGGWDQLVLRTAVLP